MRSSTSAFFWRQELTPDGEDFNEKAYRKERGSNGWADEWIDSKVE